MSFVPSFFPGFAVCHLADVVVLSIEKQGRQIKQLGNIQIKGCLVPFVGSLSMSDLDGSVRDLQT